VKKQPVKNEGVTVHQVLSGILPVFVKGVIFFRDFTCHDLTYFPYQHSSPEYG
jgi:hypothetical protein